MTSVAVIGSKQSPGASTLAMAVAALTALTQPTLLIEADPAGGDLAARTGLALDPGLLTLTAAARRGLTAELLDVHAQRLANGVDTIGAPSSPDLAHTAIAAIAHSLAAAIRDRAGVTVIDAGRWDSRTVAAEVVAACETVVVAFRPTVEGVEHARARLDALSGRRVIAAMIGETPYRAVEVAAVLDGAALCVIEWDPRAASAISAGRPVDRWLRRTALLRCAQTIVEHTVTPTTAVGVAS